MINKMSPPELAALNFWNAAKFLRRAPDRNQKNTLKVLRHVAKSTFKPAADRAIEILKGIDNVSTS